MFQTANIAISSRAATIAMKASSRKKPISITKNAQKSWSLNAHYALQSKSVSLNSRNTF